MLTATKSMAELIRWPFPLPRRFLEALGYTRTVEAFESPARRARLAELLRRQDIQGDIRPPSGTRRYVALWWEAAGDELAFSDGVHSGVGQLDHRLWLDYLYRRGGFRPSIFGWMVEHDIDLGSSERLATYALIVDGDAGVAHVAPIGVARRIVRQQSLDHETQP
jgi:hypothetical protein